MTRRTRKADRRRVSAGVRKLTREEQTRAIAVLGWDRIICTICGTNYADYAERCAGGPCDGSRAIEIAAERTKEIVLREWSTEP